MKLPSIKHKAAVTKLNIPFTTTPDVMRIAIGEPTTSPIIAQYTSVSHRFNRNSIIFAMRNVPITIPSPNGTNVIPVVIHVAQSKITKLLIQLLMVSMIGK